jgi:hypothetical protein
MTGPDYEVFEITKWQFVGKILCLNDIFNLLLVVAVSYGTYKIFGQTQVSMEMMHYSVGMTNPTPTVSSPLK